MSAQSGIYLLTPDQVPFVELVPGMGMARAISAAGVTQFAGGYMRLSQDAEYRDWTLTYDEVLFVHHGTLEIVASDGTSVKAEAGEAILIESGTTVTYRASSGSECFYVVWPRNVGEAIQAAREAGGEEAAQDAAFKAADARSAT